MPNSVVYRAGEQGSSQLNEVETVVLVETVKCIKWHLHKIVYRVSSIQPFQLPPTTSNYLPLLITRQGLRI